MAGPWDQFAPKEVREQGGPWEAYQQRPPTPTEGPGGYNVDIFPGRQDSSNEAIQKGTIEALKMGGMLAGGAFMPQIPALEGAGLLMKLARPVLNFGARMLGAGAGSATGGEVGELVRGNSSSGEDLWKDFKEGATAEALGTGAALIAKPFVSLAGNAITKIPFGVGKAMVNKAEEKGLKWGKDAFDKLTQTVGGNDAAIPAPNTLQVLREGLIDPEKGAWTPFAKKLFGKDTSAPPGARPAAEQALSGAPPGIGKTTAWELTPKGEIPAEYATVKPLGGQWEPWYLVHADGGAELFWRDPKMGLYRTPGAASKAKELLTEDQMLSWVGASRAGVPAVGVIEAAPAANGNFVPRGKLFDVARRDDAIPWRELNDLGAKFRNRDFTNLSKEEIDTFMRLREAIAQDVRGHSPEAAKLWDKAWASYHFGRDPVGATTRAITKYGTKPAGALGAMGVQSLFQPSHEVKR